MRLSWITEYFDTYTLEKGRDYFEQKRVKYLTEDKDWYRAKVWGTDINPYQVEIHMDRNAICHAECSCPMGDDCKHCAAVALAAAFKFAGNGPAGDKSKISLWKKILQPLIGEPVGISSEIQNEPTKWNLQILLRTREPEYYEEITAEGAELFLEFRPQIIHGDTGKTFYRGVEWKNLDYLKNNDYRYYVDEQEKQPPRIQLIWLCKMLDALNPGTGYFYPKDWVAVPARKAKEVLSLILQAEDFNILIKDLGQIQIETSGEPIRETLVIKENKNGINVAAELTDKEKILNKEGLLIGNPPVFALLTDKNPGSREPMQLRPVIPSNGDISNFKVALSIPKNEIKQFTDEYLPLLSRDYHIISEVPAIKPPILGQPMLNISITKDSKNSIRLSRIFTYDGNEVRPTNNIYLKTGQETPVARNLRQENRLHSLFVSKIAAATIKTAPKENFSLTGLEAKNFLEKAAPELKKQTGINLELAADLPSFREITEAPKIEIELEDSQSTDWFDLRLKISIDGINLPLAEVLSALAQNNTTFFLPDGRFIDLSKNPEIQKLQALLKRANKLKEVQNGKLTISKYEAGWFDQLKELGIVAKQSQIWENSVGKLKTASAPELLLHPKNWEHQLRGYQLEGYSWLSFLAENNLGGILADDMGLGKTAQSIALICKLAAVSKEPVLIVAPTSVVENWDTELEKFAPGLKKSILRSGNRNAALKSLAKNNVVVTSYALVRRDFEILKKQPWKMLILDEAQMLKNYQSQSYGLIRQLHAKVKIGLSGTPMENNLSELWSVLSIVCPGLFSDIEHFKETYQKPIEKLSDKPALESLRRQIRPFILRRKKELVEKDLPLKIEQVSVMDLGEEHRKIYDLWLTKQRQLVLGLIEQGGMKANRFAILTALTRLRQLCLHPALVDKKHSSVEAVKVEGLTEQIEAIVDGGHQVLVFSQFTGFLDIVEKRLQKEGYVFSRIDGSTKKRQQEITNFNSNKTKIFLISLKAGGFGLNLTAADYCILLDPWWNPATEAQAIDRAHRIGQTKQVMVYRFIAKNTIEEKVLKLQEKKRALFKNVLDEGEFFSQMINEEDIKSILE